jgi:hypothetical protein
MQRTRVLWVVLVVLGLALFLTGCDLVDDTVDAAWAKTAADAEFAGPTGTQFLVTLPAGGSFHSVWGTSVYTDDSSIGTAAVHDGRITFADGGTVTIQILDGQAAYIGSTQNGVTTEDYGVWDRSFQFVP